MKILKKIFIISVIVLDSLLIVIGAIIIINKGKNNVNYIDNINEEVNNVNVVSVNKSGKFIYSNSIDNSENQVNDSIKNINEENTSKQTEYQANVDDFKWYMNDVYKNGIPTSGIIMSDFAKLEGEWRGFIWYDPENANNSKAMELAKVNISGTDRAPSLLIDWQTMITETEALNETTMQDTIYICTLSENGLISTDGAGLKISSFYTLNGKQYAIGTIGTVDGISSYIALVR